jgi:hypothetical protein
MAVAVLLWTRTVTASPAPTAANDSTKVGAEGAHDSALDHVHPPKQQHDVTHQFDQSDCRNHGRG